MLPGLLPETKRLANDKGGKDIELEIYDEKKGPLFLKLYKQSNNNIQLIVVDKAIIATLATGILVIAVMAGFCHTWANLPGLLNPEYHALERLVNMVK